MKYIAYIFFILGILSIFFNISHLPGMSGKSIRYYEDYHNAYIVGSIQILIGIIFTLLSKNKNNK